MASILIAGDIMLDTYVFGTVGRISPEAPVPVLLEDRSRMRYVPGGASNVAVNVRAAGCDVTLVSVIGDDENGDRLHSLLESEGIDCSYLCRSSARPTTSKLRFIGQSNQQILRVDNESSADVVENEIGDLFDRIEKQIDEYELIIISDYSKGFLTYDVCQRLIELGNEHDIPVLVDVKDRNVSKYRGAFLLKPNRSELESLTGLSVRNVDEAANASVELCRTAGCRYVLSTLGADGMVLTDSDGMIRHVETVAREVYDVTGAGDTSIAYLAAAIVEGKSIEEAVVTANIAAGIQVSKMGTSLVYPDEVERARNSFDSLAGKALNLYRPKGFDRLERNREGKKIVFTNGCFDILHAGHVTYLQKAKELGDILVVGINSDSSVKRLKGDSRPINGVEDRMKILAALACVDYVVVFEEDTPLDLIKQIKPDILVKGGDYEIDKIVGADYVASYGGITTTIPLVEGRSTTAVIEKINTR